MLDYWWLISTEGISENTLFLLLVAPAQPLVVPNINPTIHGWPSLSLDPGDTSLLQKHQRLLPAHGTGPRCLLPIHLQRMRMRTLNLSLQTTQSPRWQLTIQRMEAIWRALQANQLEIRVRWVRPMWMKQEKQKDQEQVWLKLQWQQQQRLLHLNHRVRTYPEASLCLHSHLPSVPLSLLTWHVIRSCHVKVR